jgi:hypothetical protein
MISVDIDIDKIDNIGAKTRTGIIKYIKKGADRGFATYLDRMPVDRGNMQQNSYSPEIDGDRVRYGTRNIPYAEAVDEGTAAFQPPVSPLVEWSKRVAGDPGLGYYVALHKIPTEGIEAQHFSRDAIQAQANWYQSHSVQSFLDRELD